MTPEQTARVTEALKSIGLGDVAEMVEDAVEQSGGRSRPSLLPTT